LPAASGVRIIRPVNAAETLARVPLFADLASEELALVAERLSEHTFEPGAHVTAEGGRGARVLAFFVIVDGTATVSKRAKKVATLGPGDYFGEIALMLDAPRTATVTADTALSCLATSAWAFRPLLAEDTPLAERLLTTMANRLDELRRLA
jgi:CRP-like cAMP-binding protein